MERPGFCGLLSFGSVLCVLGIIAGSLIVLSGFLAAQQSQQLAVYQFVAGAACIINSMVFLGVINALLWIVDHLLTMSPADRESPRSRTREAVEDEIEQPEPFHIEERDGIRNKPTLRRRKF